MHVLHDLAPGLHCRPSLLLVGNVTVDLVDGKKALVILS